MILRTRFAPLLAFILLSACAPSQSAPPPTATQPVPVSTATPTLTPPPTPTPTFAVAPLDDAANTVYYFAPDVCTAKWTNSGETLPCPGISGQIDSGFIGLLTQTELTCPTKQMRSCPFHHRMAISRIFRTFLKIKLWDFFPPYIACRVPMQCHILGVLYGRNFLSRSQPGP